MTSFPIALHQQIRAMARIDPDAPALASFTPSTVRLTRGELDSRAARLAARLRAAGVTTEVRVGVCVARSCDLFVALLAVLKAGGVFVALDPRHPPARLDWIARDAGLLHGIVDDTADAAMRARFSQCVDVTSVASAATADAAAPCFDNEDAQVHPRAAAYMIYTSGSTGTPKAVAVEHGPLAAHGEALAESLPIAAADRVLHFASVNFDVSIEAWLVPLAVGGSVVISDPPPFGPETTHAFMRREGITNTTLPPAYVREFANVCERLGVPPSLRTLLFGGEAMSQDSFDEIRRVFPSVRLVNGYGPTETVISPMLWPVDPGMTPALDQGNGFASLPIGWPIGRRVARIDGAAHRGEAGELLLGGVCLARGYHGRAALTAERFLPDPTGEPGERIYRTGDLARERADGSFDYLGRIDDQVQVRGVRVEPGEIAACLLTHPAVVDAGVLAEAAGGRAQLIACVVLQDALAPDDAALRTHLAAHLPQAWMPHRFERFERLPYTLNGKLDRAALRDFIAVMPAAIDSNYVAPRTVTETRLATLWQKLLNDPALIGCEDRFFMRGGDSLAAMQLQAAIRVEWRVNLRLDELFDDQSLEVLARLIDASETETSAGSHSITVVRTADAPFVEHAASFAQQRFWVLAQTQDAGAAYHVAVQWDVRGALEIGTLQRALDCLIARHQAWRTTLVESSDGIVVQRIHASLPVPVAQTDLRAYGETERASRLAALTEQQVGTAFDLSQGPLVRAALVTLTDSTQRFLLTTHHSISDGWSSRCAFDELRTAYAAFATGHEPRLPALTVQYADYARWQRDWLAAGEGERQLAYWRDALRDAPEALALPLDRPRSPEHDYRGGRLALRLPAALSEAVRETARRAQASPFTVLLAAFDAWLYRLTGVTDVVVAAPIAHRQRAEIAPLVGLFLNTLALRVRVAPDRSFAELLDGVRRSTFDAFAHQDVPFDQVLDTVKPPVRRGDAWLKVKFAQQFDLELTAELPGATVRMSPGLDLAARFDYALDFTDDSRGIELVAAYALDGIDEPTAHAWLHSYAALVADAVRDPQRAVTELDCADNAEYRAARRGRELKPMAGGVLALFARHARETPHRVALADAEMQLTYGELDEVSDRIAFALRRNGAGRGVGAGLGVGAEQPVAVCIERSVRFAIAAIGVMKSGAYLVPLDPAAPHERLAASIDACGARWVLTSSQAQPGVTVGGAASIDVDMLTQETSSAYAGDLRATASHTPPLAGQAAYLIFTSGSTGTPKGVVISHAALADYVEGMLDELAFAPDASMAMVSTVAADLGHTTLFGALCSGRTLHLLPAHCAFDPDRFAHEMRTRNVGILKIVPSHLHALLDAQHPADVLPAHALVTGGETLPWSLVERIAALKPACRVINHYGPTEATVGALTCDTSAPAQAALRALNMRTASAVPLGLPLPNAYACVLDSNGASVPPGAIGELHLGGPGLARGYLNRAAATAERFVPHPFVAGERLYRTGDRVRLRADRRLDFLGRLDDQVKIRGYRVEPGEISAALRALAGIAQAQTLAVEHEGRLRLVSFVTVSSDARFDEAALRASLGTRLPDYMVPAVLQHVAALPVTANGKVDRAALRALAVVPAATAAAGDAPRGATEQALAAVWKDVLKAERVGREDNFFELGGDSILVLQVIARSRKRGVRFTPKQLFDAPTLAQLARVATTVDLAAQAAASAAKVQAAPSTLEQAVTLTPAQLRFFALDIPRRGHWNQSIELDTQAPFDFDAFSRAFETLLTHHEIFRQRFAPVGSQGEWRLTFAACAFETLPLAAVSACDEADALAQFDAMQSALDLTHGPLVCALAALLPDGTTKLYLAIHHLIVDGVSWRVLLDDLDAAYRAACERRSIRLTSTGTSARDWTARLARAALEIANSPFAVEIPYWTALAAPYDDLPLDHPQARATNADAQSVIQTIGADLTRAALTQANAAYRTQTIELLIAALAHSLGLPVCRIELEGHGREALFDDVDVSRTPGWLTSHYPVQFALESAPEATLGTVKDTLRSVPNKGLGFGVLRHYGDPATRTALAAVPRPHVTFNYLGQFDTPRDAALVPRFGGAGRERDPAGPLGNALAIHAYIDGDATRTLKVHWVYGATQFERATVEAIARRFESALAELIAACTARLAQRGGGATPGDYPLARAGGLTQAALDRLPLDLRTVDDIYPLSPTQHGILFHSLFAPEQSTYVNQLVATLIEPDVERLRTAFEAAVPRHDILRTGFTPDEATPMQIVHRQARMPVEVLDWRERGVQAIDAFGPWLDADRARGFDLTSPPLMRVALIRITDNTWRLVWTRHHLLLDGWSTARFFADVLRDYIEPPRPQPFAAPAKTRYRDFIAWLAARDAASERAFWLQRLALLDEPTLVAERAPANGGCESCHFTRRETVDAAMTARLTDTARRLKVTVNTIVQGAWSLALQRVMHRTAVAFGATVAGRPDSLPDADTVLGLFINTLPVIATPLPQCRASAWLHDLQRDNAAAAEHAHTPLYEIQQWAGQGGGALFDTLVVFENYPVDEAWQGRDERALKLRELRNVEATDFALTLVIEAGATLTIDYGYDAARLDESRVAALHRAFETCLAGLIANPDALLGTISIAGADDLSGLARLNSTARAWPPAQQQALHRQFESRALASPEAIALEFGDSQGRTQQMTYGELNANADRVAASLMEAGVRADTAVALCVERSFDMVVALIGVLKAGAAYLPVDPDYPADRIAYLLNDAKPAVALTQPHLLERVTQAVDSATVKILTIDALRGADFTLSAPVAVAPDQLAYLIYTSGSTGKPKGAGNTHRALANRIAWMQDAYRLNASDVVLHKTPFGFDVSVWEFMWPLAVGAKLAIAAPGDHRDPARLVAAVETYQVTTLHFVPSMLAAFVAHLEDFHAAARCASIERIVASGEALAPELVARVAQQLPRARLYNLYGPTEAAIDVSHWTCEARDAAAAVVPIGHPIANVQLHVLDAALQPLPPGAIGELYLGGAGLARGYLGRPALTAERFVPDPFAHGARLYRTGDLARRRADGALDYLGRMDTQVKLRGQRIEPGEIEALLRAAPGVHDAVVIVRDERLIGYVARGADNALDTQTLLDGLHARLPSYMVPSHLIQMDVLPVTPNGKCDRHALPAPVRGSADEQAVALLATGTERELAAIWKRVLRVDTIGRDDDFFALGGHSLLATQANAQANLHWTLILPLRTLFDERTLRRCAAAIDLALAERDAHGAGNTASAIDALLDEFELQ